jgi:competence ComEA-like helix-hairpin-helix protein
MKFFLSLLLFATVVFGAVDINNASAEELATLKKIGMKKAAKIIAYRQTHCFKDLKELKNVKGISKKRAKKIIKKNRGNISVGVCKVAE